MSVADFVRREILRHFSGDSADEVERLLLTATPDPGLDEPDRIHFAILRIANGDVAAAGRAAEMAGGDWRDVLASAGLGERDWRRVLIDAGVELNPIAFHGERTTTGIVKFWRNAQGHGVIAADETAPWDIWCHFAAVEGDGFRSLTPGQRVEVRYYCFPQESFLYVAKHVRPL